MHKIFRLEWHDVKLIIPILLTNQEYKKSVCPASQILLQEAMNHKMKNKDVKIVVDFYNDSLHTLLQKFLKGKSLPKEQLQRIAYEITPDHRKYLEQQLSMKHPLFQEIDKQLSVQVNPGFSIVL